MDTLDYATELADERVRAHWMGADVVIGADDRPIADGWDRGSLACPTCEDGLRTLSSPVRCRQCILADRR